MLKGYTVPIVCMFIIALTVISDYALGYHINLFSQHGIIETLLFGITIGMLLQRHFPDSS